MKSEMKCDDDQDSLSKEERKQKKEERKKKKRERLDKENTSHVEHLCEGAARNTLLEVVTENSKKKHKRKKHSSDSVGDNIVSDEKTGEHSINEGKTKRQKTEDIDQTTNNCNSSPAETKSKKKKRKKEKTIATDPLCDTSELPGDRQDVTQSVKKKNKKHKKAKTELADGEKVRTVSPLETDGDTTHERKGKKPKRVSLSSDETIEDTKHTDSKENNSSPVEEESSKCRKKKKKHSKHQDCEPVHESDNEMPRKKHKKKSKSTSSIKDGALQGNTEEDNSVETNYITKHGNSNADISQTSDKGSKHKKQKHHSKNSPADSTDNNFNGKQEICSEVTACDKPTSDTMTKPKLSPVGTSTTLGNWQGNLFENNDRQNKFLRLLGGMKKSSNATAEISKYSATLAGTKKKGLFGSLASLSNTGSSGGNMALDVNAAATLNQKLEDEYNKAMNFKLSGKVGTGFGFVKDPAEGKKFHIDVSKSKSVKFDDD